jgi:hypothetical protein
MHAHGVETDPVTQRVTVADSEPGSTLPRTRAERLHPKSRLDGNRIWLVATPEGPVVQKLYAERRGLVRRWGRRMLTAALPRKSSPSARARKRTEERLLLHWHEAGFDVPELRTARHPELGGPLVNVIEFVEGRVLGRLLTRDEVTGADRDELLSRFAADMSRRHARALETRDSALIQTHATLFHVIVRDDRFVTIDLERAHRRRRNLVPLIAREIGGCLRSIAKRMDEDAFARDVRAFVAGYDRRDILAAVVREAESSRHPVRRAIRSLDRRRKRHKGHGSKHIALDHMMLALRSAAD